MLTEIRNMNNNNTEYDNRRFQFEFCLLLSDLKNKWHLVVDRLTVLFLKFLEYFHKLQVFIWWLLEIHIIKIVASYIVMLALQEVRFNQIADCDYRTK